MHGTPNHHMELREGVVDYMRMNRDHFEGFVTMEDVQQRRALRAKTLAAKVAAADDAFEGYLMLMAQSGSYGGQPEVVAFCQAYNQDVIVHLPILPDFAHDMIHYRNELRGDGEVPEPLHISYGGEMARAHYNSIRSKKEDTPPVPERPRAARTKLSQVTEFTSNSKDASTRLTVRGIHKASGEISSARIQAMLKDGRREIDGSFEQLNDTDRTRSPSVSSSHRSSSSKRSLDDDTDYRTTKKADRRKSIKKRADALVPVPDQPNDMSFRLRIESPSPGTPASTQDTEYSSDAGEPSKRELRGSKDVRVGLDEDASDSEASLEKAMRNMKAQSKGRKTVPSVAGHSTPASQVELANLIEVRRASTRQ